MHETKQMRWLASLLILMSCLPPSYGAENNLTRAEIFGEVPITPDDDSEQELSSQLQEVDRSGGWSEWSEWSACSRSCDGGVSHQLRTCTTGSCRGEHVRYKICNMQIVGLFAVLACANAGVLLAPSARIIQGPSSSATVVGPDGSAISSIAPGGRIVSDQQPGFVAGTAPVVAAAPVLAAAPVARVAYASPLAYAGRALYL